MNELKKFILKIVLFLILFSILWGGIFTFDYFVIGNQYLGNYQASLIDKVERLESIEQPKIILIGNSNLSFGMNSEMLETAFGMPVVNMGLHAGLGNAFHENMVKLGVSEGDIVILCHTDYSDDDSIGDPELAWITVEFHKELWKLIRKKDYITMLSTYPKYFRDAFRLWICGEHENILSDEGCYSRTAFNQYGDIVRKSDDSYEFTESSVSVPEISDTCVDRINQLNEQYINKKGATLLIAGYPIGEGEYTPATSLYTDFEKKLRKKVDCDVISHYTDYLMPYQYFYNTNLHLNEKGTKIRTKQLIKDLKQWLETQS